MFPLGNLRTPCHLLLLLVGVCGYYRYPYVMTGQNDWVFAFCPSARDSHLNNTSAFPIGQRGMYQRSLTDVYVRGYKEIISMATSSGAHWLWRRIVVTMKTPLWNEFPLLLFSDKSL